VFEALQQAEAFEDVDAFRHVQVNVMGHPVLVSAVHMPSVRHQERIQLLPGQPADPMEPLARGEPGAIVSEPMAFREGLEAGDSLTIPTPSGPQTIPVNAIFYDYSSDAGMVLVDRTWFKRHWNDGRPESVAIYLPEGMSLEEGREKIRAALPEGVTTEVFSNRQLRDQVLVVFDHTFAITYALEAVAIIVALLAVGGGMASLVAERTRELAILRAVGASTRQQRTRVLYEAGLLGGAGWAVGTVLGIVLSMILTFVVNKYSFGWSLMFRPWEGPYLTSLLLIVPAALLAGWVPAARAAKVPIARGVRME
jgi:putative ABC transport system permease protein